MAPIWVGASRRVFPSDCVFLAALVGLSILPYVASLGFYSDDWNILGQFVTAPDKSLHGLMTRQWDFSLDLHRRPLQMAYQVVLYRAFGLDPLGYHLVNAAVLSTTAILFYCVLRKLGFSRVLGCAIPALYILLPQFSTNRFWFASFVCALTIALYLLSVYATLQALSSARRAIAWMLLALGALTASGFGYELVLPFLLATPLLAWIWRRMVGLPAKPLHTAFFVANYVLLGAVIVFKLAVSVEGGAPHARQLAKLAFTAVVPNFGTYGLGLPQATGWALTETSAVALGLSVVLAAGVFAWLVRVRRAETSTPEAEAGTRDWVHLLTAGLALFALGYAIFLVTGRFSVSSSSYGNRIAMAAALGVAICFVALIGRVSLRFLPLGVAVLCQCAFLITAALGDDFVRASSQQETVLRQIESTIPHLQRGSTVIMRGPCPYVGAAIVFERLDLEGALRVKYRDDTLHADVGSKLALQPKALQTTATGYTGTYPYGGNLFLVDPERRLVARLSTAKAALMQLGKREVGWSPGCPRGAPDMGVPIFPADRFYAEHIMQRFP